MSRDIVIAVDVDLTVVDSVTPWKAWYTKLTGHDLGEVTSENNNLEEMMKNHNDPMQFWRQPDLYDNLQPIKEAVRALKKLHNMGYKIIFVSACQPEHEVSKRMFLGRNFPYHDGFISTGDKKHVACDYFIDDYKKYCRQQNDRATVFQIKTELNSSSNGEFAYVDWEEIVEIMEEEFSKGYNEWN